MNTVPKTNPSTEVSDSEVLADIFQAIRVREISNVPAVKELFVELFPDMPAERQEHCLVKLANMLVHANPEIRDRRVVVRKPGGR